MSNNKKYHSACFIGRFSPYHIGHHKVVLEALEQAEQLIMILGSHNEPRTARNPFTTEERIEIIKSALTDDQISRIKFTWVENHRYNDAKWVGEVQKVVHNNMGGWSDFPKKIALIGHTKNDTKYYLSLFPTWDSIEVENHEGINATSFRNALYDGRTANQSFSDDRVRYHTNSCIVNVEHGYEIQRKYSTDDFKDQAIKDEGNLEYRGHWGEGPHMCTDALVTQSGYILLIKRGEDGKGLWALPGGFLENDLSLIDNMIKELYEETNIKVQERIVRSKIEYSKVYDAVNRSERARIITQTSLIRLDDGPLPKVKGGDDATEARWFSVSEFLTMRNKMYDDHFDMISDMLGI